MSSDVGLDATVDALLVRANQLVKNEGAAAAEQKSHAYALKRKLNTMKEQLDGKVQISRSFNYFLFLYHPSCGLPTWYVYDLSVSLCVTDFVESPDCLPVLQRRSFFSFSVLQLSCHRRLVLL